MSQYIAELSPQVSTSVVQGHILTPFQRKLLIKSLQTDLRPEYRQRIEIMLLADQGHSQAQICKLLGCYPSTVRYWISFAQAGNAHQWNEHQIGRPKTIDDDYLDRLRALVNDSPRQHGYPFQRWTAHWLGKHLAKETGTEISDRHINRLLKQMGLSTRPTRASKLVPEPGQTELSGDRFGILIRDLHHP
ncbi:MAG TPA: helix-turn-helix domain-containing protein [Crinalium sp.]|jgi:transposase